LAGTAVESWRLITYTGGLMRVSLTRRTALLAMPVLLLITASAGAAGERAETARELDAIQARIKGLEKEIAKAAAAKPTAGKALKQAEQVEADARTALQGIRRQIADGQARENGLRAEMARADAELASHRAALEWQLRLAYATGREEWLRLALTQQDPVSLSRRVVYYGYITRQRSSLLQQVQQEMESLKAAADELRDQLAALADLGKRQEARLRELSAARLVRARAVDTLDHDLGTRQQKLTRLRRDAHSLTDLMERLNRESRASARQAEPMPQPGPAQQLHDLPLRGRMVGRFGQPRAEGLLRWDGLMLEAPAGSAVRAVRGGRVVYADWLPGMGLLVVVDHGKGYMSLYGHNQDLLKDVGQTVSQGEVISRVGDSGGQGSPGLYFEVRRDGKPIDPQSWVR
jgi:septal ring factor EnvC (AmiA/AmiB activator)